MSFICCSQGLRPSDIIFKNNDTLFCWNINQSKHLAKKIIHGEFCDSISDLQEQELVSKDSIINIQKLYISTLALKGSNLKTIISINEEEKTNLKKEIKRQEFFKWGAFSFSAICIAIAILK